MVCAEYTIRLWILLLTHLCIAASYRLDLHKSQQYHPAKHRQNALQGGLRYVDTLSWTVQLHVSEEDVAKRDDLAASIAQDTGLVNMGQIGHLAGYYLFTHKLHSKVTKLGKKLKNQGLQSLNRDDILGQALHDFTETDLLNRDRNDSSFRNTVVDHVSLFQKGRTLIGHEQWEAILQVAMHKLEAHAHVASYSQEIVRSRQKREIRFEDQFEDPKFIKQWHLVNHVEIGFDINVTGVWEHNVTGQGVTAVVVDDGLQWTNPDLQDNYSAEGSWDLNDNDADPMAEGVKAENHHGTRCAGEIAAAANTHCGVGVAYEANIAGIRVLDGPMTDSLEATAFTKNLDVNDIYSCSWGPDDDGKTVDGPHHLAAKSLHHGIDYGRGGYGAIYVVASGNGGPYDDNCNFDGYANSIYTVTIGAVDESGAMPYYAEECASMLAVTFSSGSAPSRNIVTTDWTPDDKEGCTDRHTGTSAAAPIAAGLIALMLQVRPSLTWRDVQYVIIMTAVKVDIDVAHWQRNAAGLHHSHKHGFGLMDAWRLVNAAKVWRNIPFLTSFTCKEIQENSAIPIFPDRLDKTCHVTKEVLRGYGLYSLEYVQVTVTLTHRRRGDIEIVLTSPSGTHSVMAATRSRDNSTDGFNEWSFSTVRCWGERPEGEWLLTVADKGKSVKSRGKLVKWRLKLFGSPLTYQQVQKRIQLVNEAASGKFLTSNFSLPVDPPPVRSENFTPISDRLLKVLVLAGLFCIVVAVYEIFEDIFCYKEEKKESRRLLRLSAQARHLAEDEADTSTVSERTGLLDAEEIPMADLRQTSDEVNDVIREERRLGTAAVCANHFTSSDLDLATNRLDDDEVSGSNVFGISSLATRNNASAAENDLDIVRLDSRNDLEKDDLQNINNASQFLMPLQESSKSELNGACGVDKHVPKEASCPTVVLHTDAIHNSRQKANCDGSYDLPAPLSSTAAPNRATSVQPVFQGSAYANAFVHDESKSLLEQGASASFQ